MPQKRKVEDILFGPNGFVARKLHGWSKVKGKMQEGKESERGNSFMMYAHLQRITDSGHPQAQPAPSLRYCRLLVLTLR
eukprot:COSAG05_NODE_31_length_28416_cov_170.150652_18_plen_79_part_00